MRKHQPSSAGQPATSTMAARILAMTDWSWQELKDEWARLFGGAPPNHNRRYAQKRIAYQWQEDEFRQEGAALLARNQRRIKTMIETGVGSHVQAPAHRKPVHGVMLTRHYGGQEHQVLCLGDKAFQYDGQIYASLSAIARKITGTQWSGPVFFGLRKRKGVG